MSRHRSLDPIFSPRTVAVVGASRKRDSIGFALIHNLIASEFNGAIFPINPHADVVHSLKCYPSLAAVPDPVDLALIAVPKALVPGVVEEALAGGVRGLVVITAGFAETGAEGAVLERRIRESVRSAGVRMIGPNCMGVINTDPGVRLNATFAPTPARAGSIGFVSQSGALGVAVLNVAADSGIGLTQFASMGNKADVSGNDLLEYWEDDPRTRVIAMYLESFGNPRRFTEIAKRVGRKKPILVVKSGRTLEGARAASSHTGALAGADVTVSAILDHCGVIRANTIEELFDVALVLNRCPLPSGSRIAVLTNAGGPGIMATDACVNLGLKMADLGATTRRALAAFLPPEASLANPVDMIASATPDHYRRSLEVILDDPGVDMVMVINVTPLVSRPMDILESVSAALRERDEASPRKPVLAVMMATEEFYEEARQSPDHPPVFRFPEAAARAFARLAQYGAWRRRPEDLPVPTFEVDHGAISRILARVGEGYLPQEDALRVLDLLGVPTAGWHFLPHGAPPGGPGSGRGTGRDGGRDSGRDSEDLLGAARKIGYPVVLKADVPGLVHKSEARAVVVGLEDDEALREAFDRMAADLAAAGLVPRGYLLQEMAAGGHEVIFGISTDPRFGPLMMFGLGGKYVEVFGDVRFGVTPLAPQEAEDMIQGIRGSKLLSGVRGEAAADLGILTEVLLRLAQLAQRHPEIRELDINPFLAAPERQRARALDVRIQVGHDGQAVKDRS